ncbi:MAG TPA: DUF3618 domain-containing protein [Allosphingosinicella sp.]|nr:DUF3618 domain-containing protein [Allosphingosinicella sp.]
MTLESVEDAKRNTIRARGRLESTLCALQQRLRPTNLAGEAWDGVKDKSADIADGALQAVKKRPGIASAALGALALFLAREPIRRAVTRMLSDEEEGIDPDGSELNEAAPDADRNVAQGVS